MRADNRPRAMSLVRAMALTRPPKWNEEARCPKIEAAQTASVEKEIEPHREGSAPASHRAGCEIHRRARERNCRPPEMRAAGIDAYRGGRRSSALPARAHSTA